MLRLACVALNLLLTAGAAWAGPLVVLVDTATDMPMARFVQGRLVEGIHKDIGDALAKGTGSSVSFLALPRKRIADALERGSADVLCSYMPEWLPGAFDWSIGFVPITEILVTSASVRRPAKLEDVAGQKIGTVLGYSHPELEEVLGSRFVREDGPSTEGNLRKLQAGRVQHVVTGGAYFAYRMRQGDLPLSVHPPLVVKTYMGKCAVSRHGHVTLAQVNGVIEQMVREGTVSRILQRYQ